MTHSQYVESASIKIAMHLAFAQPNKQNGRHYYPEFTHFVDEFKHLAKVAPRAFNFSSWLHMGESLFVGEGNLSFSLALAKNNLKISRQITATTFENWKSIDSKTVKNARALINLGCNVKHGINAKDLDDLFTPQSKSLIVFQFPHSGSRTPQEGRNPNYILLRDFLKSARICLTDAGRIAVTTVDTPHYRGAFQYQMAAEQSGFDCYNIHRFYPSQFRGYTHTNTNDEDSALSHHKKYCTWVFKKK